MGVFGIHTGGVAFERGATDARGPAAGSRGSRRRPLQLLLAAMVLMVGAIPFLPEQASADPLPVGVNNPPVTGSIISFPARDFVSAEGWDEAIYPAVDVQVLRQNPNDANDFIQIGVAHDVVPSGGIVEVNHPGGACWEGVTPNITAGDIVMLSAKDAIGGAVVVRDATTTADVTITQKATEIAPGVVEVRGRALRAGNAIPADELEMRLIAGSADRFDFNDRRDLRAPRDGTFTINASGDWVAIISGLGQADVDRALAAENRAVWLGANPAAGTEATIFEVGDGVIPGPSPECTNSPLQAAVVAPSRTQIDFPATEITFSSAPEVVTLLNAGAGALADMQVSAINVTGIDSAVIGLEYLRVRGRAVGGH